MKQSILIILIFIVGNLNAQKVTVSGYIYNNKNKESLPGAVVINKTTNQSTTTNDYGYYSIVVDVNTETELEIRYVGFNPLHTTTNTNKNLVKNFYLTEGAELEAVYITSSRLKDMSTFELSAEQIKLFPSLAGEKDILKAFQFMSGIQFGGEGTSNLFVRGGSPDQNLILLDNVPLYYVSHLGSFVSVFDVNAIKSVKLYKGEFPAKYGGRLSSVMDIKLKDGDMKKHQAEIFVGFLSSKISLNGPIIKDKMSYLFTLRRCNIDLISRTLDLVSSSPTKGGYTFYDVNFKLSYKLSKNNNLHLFAYNGRDKHFILMENSSEDPALAGFNNKFSGKINNKWGNFASGLNWTHKFNKIYSSLNIGVTSFYYQTQRNADTRDKNTDTLINKSSSNFSNQVKSCFIKQNFDFYITNTLNLNFGVYAFQHSFNPGNLFYEYEEINVKKTTSNSNQEILTPTEAGVYINISKNIFDIFDMSIGVHSSAFFSDDTAFYSIQPRLKSNITISDDINLKFAYSTGTQYLHLLTLSTSLVPADIWVPATKKAIPSKVNLFSLGATKKIASNKFLVGFDVFYKKLSNLINLIPFAEAENTSTDNNWQSQIATNGKGNIYGLELMISKNTGKFTGWLSYTYMKNNRQYNQINDGEKFPYYYDRRHYFTIFTNYNITDNIHLSANFVLATGMPITASTQKQNIENFIYATSFLNTTNYDFYYDYYFNHKEVNYTQLNNYRLPIYHRLDLNLDFQKQTKKHTRTWSFSVYNTYNHHNPYFIYFQKDKYDNLRLFQFTLFPIIPSISYSFKF